MGARAFFYNLQGHFIKDAQIDFWLILPALSKLTQFPGFQLVISSVFCHPFRKTWGFFQIQCQIIILLQYLCHLKNVYFSFHFIAAQCFRNFAFKTSISLVI